MKKNFEIPVIGIDKFSIENVATLSGKMTNAETTEANLKEVGVTNVQTLTFDDIIKAE